jgi:hypothetical protein
LGFWAFGILGFWNFGAKLTAGRFWRSAFPAPPSSLYMWRRGQLKLFAFLLSRLLAGPDSRRPPRRRGKSPNLPPGKGAGSCVCQAPSSRGMGGSAILGRKKSQQEPPPTGEPQRIHLKFKSGPASGRAAKLRAALPCIGPRPPPRRGGKSPHLPPGKRRRLPRL